ncbi:MAG: hypothetical protein HC794_02905 [Nitrospiraceae bacterium]|nr:hypothetical protein [Nitrospiraceae bacterium]
MDEGHAVALVSDAGTEKDMTWETGSAYWLEIDPPGELHADVNRGSEPVEVIVVQLKGVGGNSPSAWPLSASPASTSR